MSKLNFVVMVGLDVGYSFKNVVHMILQMELVVSGIFGVQLHGILKIV